jgi:thiol-disulfide isomerase/thioredoxin
MMVRKLVLLLALALALLIPLTLSSIQAQVETETPGGEEVPSSQYAGRADLPAPEFPTGVDWVNVPAPLTMQALRGKVVILDFWTYGCINCIHMIATLQRLEEKYGDALVVIGIHSAKFANEGETQNIRQIVERYGLEHPVINDPDFVVWRMYGVNAWPTFFLIDPRGNVLAKQPGEIPFDAFDRVVSGMVDYFDSTGEINRQPLELALEGADRPAGLLAFPGKVLADEASNRLFIADSSHNRVVVADLTTYEVLDVIGSAIQGLGDGSFEQAQFNTPQGMALRGDVLYIADMDNHAIRAANLSDRTVTTVAGTGEQAFGIPYSMETPAITPISSPWDLALGGDDTLYIAMAGVHQVWQMHLDAGTIQPLIGSGREGLVSTTFADSELAQPSGLFFNQGTLYIADPESSTIRAADVNSETLSTISGTTENNLFDFGDVDGAPGVSRLQHALGVTGAANGLLYVADTYNSRIKAIDPATDETTAYAGSAAGEGFLDGIGTEAEFNEPGGLSAAGNRLFVADTNNHAIRVIDLDTDTVSTLSFPNPDKLQISGRTTVIGGNAAQNMKITLPRQTVAAGEGTITVRITLPEGYKINPDAPSRAEWNNIGVAIDIPEADRAQPFDSIEFSLPVALSEGSDLLSGYLTTYYCEAERESLCFIDDVQLEVPVTVSADGAGTDIVVTREITPPEVEVGGI